MSRVFLTSYVQSSLSLYNLTIHTSLFKRIYNFHRNLIYYVNKSPNSEEFGLLHYIYRQFFTVSYHIDLLQPLHDLLQ